jgi:hypothetical protein
MKVASCVVVDTNEWIATRWFSTPIGEAFQGFIGTGKVRFAIPEVLQIEIDKHQERLILDLVDQTTSLLEYIERLSGITQKKPSPDDITSALTDRLSPLCEAAIRLRVTQEHARSALKRINDESPPNGPKNQQAKDSLQWEACLDLSEKYHVSFITRDGGFYLDRDPRKGLARNLAAEPAVQLGRLVVYPSIEEFLSAVQSESRVIPPVEIDSLVEEKCRDYLKANPNIGHDEKATLKEADVRVRAFPADAPNQLTIAFTVRFKTEYKQRTEAGWAELNGECIYDRALHQVRKFQIHAWVNSYEEARWRVNETGGEARDSAGLEPSEVHRWLSQRGDPEAFR